MPAAFSASISVSGIKRSGLGVFSVTAGRSRRAALRSPKGRASTHDAGWTRPPIEVSQGFCGVFDNTPAGRAAGKPECQSICAKVARNSDGAGRGDMRYVRRGRADDEAHGVKPFPVEWITRAILVLRGHRVLLDEAGRALRDSGQGAPRRSGATWTGFRRTSCSS
jgi:hypothetical protein